MKCSLTLSAALFAGMLSAQTSVPEIPFDSTPNFLKFPEHVYMGEGAGVATNSKGNVFVYTRTGSANAVLGGSRIFTHGGSRLFEFAPNGNYIREIGQGVYGFLLAHSVRVDAQDNIWVVDEGSSMVIKFNPEGRIAMTMGRKPEAIAAGREGGGEGGGAGGRGNAGAGVRGDNFNRPTDVAWDPAGNIFVADGHGNSRVAKFDRNGRFIKSWGTKGGEPGQFNTLHTIAVDASGNIYVGDRDNHRIQVFDNDGNFKTQYTNAGSPYGICISQGSHQYLYTSNSNPPTTMDNGEIYKMELDGRVVGKFGRAGKALKEFGTVLGLDCRNPNEVFVAESINWRVQKLTLHPNQAK
jgi:hypothetical protein